MEYQVGPFLLKTDQNLIVGDNREQSIRPKTLELLLYFINNKNEVISKQVLLDEIWQSAGAQEHVLFQSINEIRSFFTPLTVIKTHPRMGYQWLAETQEVMPLPSTAHRINLTLRKYGLLTALLLILLPTALYYTFNGIAANSPSDQKVNLMSKKQLTPSRELVVLPIENSIADSSHDWVRLGAMDMMIRKLSAEQTFMVFSAEDVMMALARSNSFDFIDIEQKSQAMRSQLGEVVTLHTKILGTSMDYQLHFSLVGRYQIKQGIVFAKNVPELLEKLTNQVMSHYQYPNDQIRTPINEQVADHNFLEAMELFHRQEYQAAIHHLVTVLKAQPNNLKAQRYLLKSLISTNNYKDAQRIGDQALAIAKKHKNQQEHLRIIFELGVLASFRGDFEIAHQLISQSKALANTHGDKLYAAYSHTQLGHLLLQKNQLIEAKSLYQTALEYHQGFQCPYGQINNLMALAGVNQQQNFPEQAEQKINEAISIAKVNALTFEHAHLLINKISLMNNSNERQEWLAQTKILISKLDDSLMKNQLKAKFNELSLPKTVQSKQ
jgi:DNA-binding winged helix-turn-helix (wHTH) protein/tetratricopeptide (TPR) repeat protein